MHPFGGMERNTAYTKAARENMAPSDAQIEEWEREAERREDEERNNYPIADYELAILTEQEEDPSWWG